MRKKKYTRGKYDISQSYKQSAINSKHGFGSNKIYCRAADLIRR